MTTSELLAPREHAVFEGLEDLGLSQRTLLLAVDYHMPNRFLPSHRSSPKNDEPNNSLHEVSSRISAEFGMSATCPLMW
jgi:hypothetical protein